MRRCFLTALVLALVSGCGVVADLLALLDGGTSQPPETGSSKLIPFASEADLVDYFSQQVTSRSQRRFAPSPFPIFGDGMLAMPTSGAMDDVALSPPSSGDGGGANEGSTEQSSGGDFSQTTIQEEGVDEPDVVKTDGSNLYIIDGGVLKIVPVSDPAQMTVAAEVTLEGFGRDIFLHGSKVVTLTTTVPGFFSSDDGVPIGLIEPDFAGDVAYERPRTVITVIDVTASAAPNVLSTTSFEGSHSASRMIDGVLHFVVSNFQDYYYDILPALEDPNVDLSTVDAAAVLPSYDRTEADGSEVAGDIVTWEQMYRPTDPDGSGVVTLISLDVDADAAFTGVGVVAQPGLIYSSLNALYLTDTEYNFFEEARETTDIYKFTYVDRGAMAGSTGSVPGRVLNQYSMGEHADHLRVATTVGNFSSATNNVYVLKETAEGLTTVGRIEGIAPGEDIRSARFLGDRGYVVTFEQIDPFFTLDLADPTNPRVVGELKVPGFSTFLVPMDETHILAVGQYIPEDGSFFSQGVQLSIFDVTDFADPQRTANVVLGEEGWAYSEALDNPKAFTYFAERDLVALPVNIESPPEFVDVIFVDEGGTGDDTGGDTPLDDTSVDIAPVVPEGFNGLVVFNVTASGGFTELGRISTRMSDETYFGASFTRGLIIENDVFAVTDRVIRSSPITALDSITYELVID